MSLTYSINLNTITESSRLESIYPVLNNLPNNTAKLISPRDVRDAFLSSWSNAIFKITTPDAHSSYPYIGIDSNNPTDKDYKKKILLGKRAIGSLDIMTPTLLSSDTDIFFHNTKDDGLTQSSTKLSILAGTNSSYYPSAPYIESFHTGSEIDFNLTNPYGPINVNSPTGRVSVNNITFPTVAETASDVADGKVLRYVGTYPSGSFQWVFPAVTTITIGSTSSTTNIYGSPVLLNGYSLEFVDDTPVPQTIGGVDIGMSFSSGSFGGQDWPMTEVIRKLLYPYVPPVLNISVDNLTLGGGTYAEAKTTNNIKIDYDITRYSYDIDYKIEYTASFPVTSLVTTGSYSGLPGTGVSSSTSASADGSLVFTPPIVGAIGDKVDFTLSVSDTLPLSYSYSVTDSITFVNPIYYGFTSSGITQSSTLDAFIATADKFLLPYGTQSYYTPQYDGEGYLYFIYPSNYPKILSEIKDPNGFIIHDENALPFSAFTQTQVIRTLPSALTYEVWRTTLPTEYDGPAEFKFKF
jgi:hypothetical protein